MSYYELPEPIVVNGNLDGGEFRPPPSANVAFHDVVARGVDFSDGEYLCLSGHSSRFEGCKFDRIRVENGPLGLYPRSLFRDCSFRGAVFHKGASPALARFERCSFAEARIEEWFTFCAEFVDCSFAGARIIGSRFFGTPFECYGWLEFRRRKRNEFSGNDFSEAELIDTAFSAGIDLDAQRLPTGPSTCASTMRRSALPRLAPGSFPGMEKPRDEVRLCSTRSRVSHVILISGICSSEWTRTRWHPSSEKSSGTF